MTDETETRRRQDPAPAVVETRARQTDRAEEVSEGRRKREVDTAVDPTLRRFGVTEKDIDQTKYDYHATVDDKMRLVTLTQHDDYDFITAAGAKATDPDAKGVLRYQSGNNVDGSPQYTYLLRKLKKFADEDRAKRLAVVNADEEARLTRTPGDAPDKSYTPKR